MPFSPPRLRGPVRIGRRVGNRIVFNRSPGSRKSTQTRVKYARRAKSRAYYALRRLRNRRAFRRLRFRS